METKIYAISSSPPFSNTYALSAKRKPIKLKLPVNQTRGRRAIPTSDVRTHNFPHMSTHIGKNRITPIKTLQRCSFQCTRRQLNEHTKCDYTRIYRFTWLQLQPLTCEPNLTLHGATWPPSCQNVTATK